MERWMVACAIVAAMTAAAMAVPALVVGGFFTSAGGLPAYMVAEWRGNHSSAVGEWSTLGAGVNHVVYAISTYKDRVVIGGSFSEAGLVPTFGVAQWDGAAWAPLGTGIMDMSAASTTEFHLHKVCAVTYDATRNSLMAAGEFSVAGQLSSDGRRPVTNAASWNGESWAAMSSLSNSVRASTMYQAAIHVAAGSYVYRWEGVWTFLGSTSSYYINAMVEYYNDLVIAGSFTYVNPISGQGVYANNIAHWNGATWSPLAAGTNGQVQCVVFHRGNIVAGGKFTEAGGLLSNYIAQWNGAAWSPLSSGMDDYVWALANYGESLVAGGMFTTAGGIAAKGIALWNGNVWMALGAGVNGVVYTLLSHELSFPSPSPTQTLPPTTTPPTLPPHECPFTEHEWRSQYYFDQDELVLVDEILSFQAATLKFAQNITAFAYQECELNWIHWTGDYELGAGGSSVLFSFSRCTPSGPGCVRCSPSYDDLSTAVFTADCDTMTLSLSRDQRPRTYYIVDTN